MKFGKLVGNGSDPYWFVFFWGGGGGGLFQICASIPFSNVAAREKLKRVKRIVRYQC